MLKSRNIKDNLFQILAITEKSINLKTRFKFNLFFSFITPVISIFLPIIIMGRIFDFNRSFGPWTAQNYIIYIFIAYEISILRGVITIFPSTLSIEKYWQTLSALIIAPFNRFNLLIGIFLSQIIIISIPFTIFFVLCYIFMPISFLTVLMIIFIYFVIALIFSGIGIILGIFAISNENVRVLLAFILNIIFWFSCISYPFELFPEIVQNFISVNPIYYIFNILRLVWIENDIFISFGTHIFHFIILIVLGIIMPSIGVVIFNLIYKKYGIVGY